ncbi:MAG: N-acetyltransferase [Oscillospiraceae bacterium]|nr:N-acetyltransferase [Oscillospiraceae bacterium]
MIRIATEEDVAQMLAIYAPYIVTTTHTFEYDVPTLEEFLQRFRTLTVQFPWLVWEENGKILGYAYGSAPFERAAYGWCAEDSIYLLPEAQGRGIGTRLYLALENILFYQGYLRIYSLITAENKLSIAFHKKLGYTLRGEMPEAGIKFGRRIGVVWMDKAADFVEIPSSFPRSWQAIVQDSQTFSDILDILSLS